MFEEYDEGYDDYSDTFDYDTKETTDTSGDEYDNEIQELDSYLEDDSSDDLDSIDISFDVPADDSYPEDTADTQEVEWEEDDDIIIPEEVERSAVDELLDLPEDVDVLPEQDNPELDEMLALEEDSESDTDEDQGNKPKVKVLTRDVDEMITAGMNTIDDILDAKSDDYRDKGYSEEEISEMLKSDRNELETELYADVRKTRR